jgi:hypothetical protein
MTIESRLNKKDYQRLILLLTYRKPMMIFFVLIGLLSLILSILFFVGVRVPFDKPPYFQMIFGFFVVIALPIVVIKGASKTFQSNLRMQEKMIYEFNQDGIIITGESFNTEMDWEKVHKIQELRNWVLIYQSNQVANIIKKESIGDNINEFRDLIKKTKY